MYDSSFTPSICQGDVRLELGQRRAAGVGADGCTTIPSRIHTLDRIHAPLFIHAPRVHALVCVVGLLAVVFRPLEINETAGAMRPGVVTKMVWQ